MRRSLVLSLICLVLLTGCGGSDTPAGASAKAGDETVTGEPTEGTAPSPAAQTYFKSADSDAINASYTKVLAAGAKAKDRERVAKCVKAGDKGYPAWRKCLHKLLDPFAATLTGLASGVGDLASPDLSAGCVSALDGAKSTFTAFRSKVDRLAAGFDSDDHEARKRAANGYFKTLEGIEAGYAEPFRVITQACYSPKDLESINASPSASPSS